MDRQLFTLTLTDPADASVEALAGRFGVDPAGFDADFGVIPVDPRTRTYAVLVDAPTAERLGAEGGAEGPFANPRIEPFGPPGEHE